MATISENLEALKTAKANIKSAIENKGQDLTGIPFTQYGQKLEELSIKGEPNFMPYLVKYVKQDDGTYEMQIEDYVEGGEGQKVLIGTIEKEDETLMDMYIYD